VKKIRTVVWILVLCFLLIPMSVADAEAGKYLVILQAGTELHEGTARAVHALLYSQELLEHGHEVVLVFDGAGTEWIHRWTAPNSEDPLLPTYQALHGKGIMEVVCDYCAGAFEVKEDLASRKVPMTSGYQGHPSIAFYVNKGYQLVIL
jgi:hypothetical protein